MRLTFKVVTAAALITGIGLAAAAAKSRHTTTAVPPSTSAGLSAGMMIATDPETGEMGLPVPGQPLSIEEAQTHAHQIAGELVTVNHPDGRSSLIHDDRLADYAVLRVGADGQPAFVCVQGEPSAREALQPGKTAQPAQPVLEEE